MKNKKVIILIFAMPILVFVLYFGYLDNRIYAVIEGKIYRSAQLSPHMLQQVITAKNIKTIINLIGVRKGESWYQLEKETALKNNVKLYNVALPDHDWPKYRALNALVDFLIHAETPLLLHCRRGADRTGMASAIALAIEQQLPIFEIKKQFSWRYGVIPYLGSIGPLVFSKYEKWLQQTNKEHSRSNLFYWLKKEYVDENGNMEFWIDSANDKPFERWKVNIRRKSSPILIKGWAYDAQTKSLPKEFYVSLTDQISVKVKHKFFRPDVEKYLGFDNKNFQKFLLGWAAEFTSDNLVTGCHKMTVKFVREGFSHQTIPTKYQLCIN